MIIHMFWLLVVVNRVFPEEAISALVWGGGGVRLIGGEGHVT